MSDDEFQDCVDDQLPAAENQGPSDYTTYSKDGFDFEVPRRWTYYEIFNFEEEALRDIFSIDSPGNTEMTPEMLEFKPTEVVMKYGQKPSRLVFYGNDHNKFDEHELSKIQEFKEWVKSQGKKIPEEDNEIIRFLYSKHWNF